MKEEKGPRTIVELQERFPDEEACLGFLRRLRWPNGFVCPRCGGRESVAIRTRRLEQCRSCRYQASLTAGTVFHRTRKPLRLWFLAIFFLGRHKTGISALQLQKDLGLGSYKTAWTWLHKLRRAMVRPGRERVTGSIEIDETYVGGLEEGVRGRQTESKVLVVIAAEEDGTGIGRIRMRRIPDASAQSLVPFVEESIEPGTMIHSDGWSAYDAVAARGYRHRVTILTRNKKSASELMPRVHRVASLLKRWLLGTHQGAVSHEHLDYYLDELTFRFNRRKSKNQGKLFYRLAQQAVAVDPVPYKEMVKCFGRVGAGKPQQVVAT